MIEDRKYRKSKSALAYFVYFVYAYFVKFAYFFLFCKHCKFYTFCMLCKFCIYVIFNMHVMHNIWLKVSCSARVKSLKFQLGRHLVSVINMGRPWSDLGPIKSWNAVINSLIISIHLTKKSTNEVWRMVGDASHVDAAEAGWIWGKMIRYYIQMWWCTAVKLTTSSWGRLVALCQDLRSQGPPDVSHLGRDGDDDDDGGGQCDWRLVIG